jgi:excisionase family DNA binding protein
MANSFDLTGASQRPIIEGIGINLMPKMISVDKLRELLDIGRDTAYNLVRRKDFPSIKLGREYRILADELPEWLHKQRRNK